MARFIEVPSGHFGVTRQQFEEAHARGAAIQHDEDVVFERQRLDPTAEKAFCLVTGPSREAVIRIHERAGHPAVEFYELRVEV